MDKLKPFISNWITHLSNQSIDLLYSSFFLFFILCLFIWNRWYQLFTFVVEFTENRRRRHKKGLCTKWMESFFKFFSVFFSRFICFVVSPPSNVTFNVNMGLLGILLVLKCNPFEMIEKLKNRKIGWSSCHWLTQHSLKYKSSHINQRIFSTFR